MMQRYWGRVGRAGWAAFGWLVLGCAVPGAATVAPSAAAEASAEVASAAQVSPGRVTDHLVVISIDGLRPDAIARYSPRALERLLREGAYSLEAQTIYPSKTLPAHTSMLTGLPPAEHGITWNSDQTEARGVVEAATIFELARARGLRTAAFFSKSKFHHLRKPGTLDHSEAPSGLNFLMATETAEATVRYLQHERPNLLFVHIAEPDYAGHTIGWMSFVYGWAVRRADGAVTRLLQAAEAAFGRGNYTVILTSDHGGHGRTHGTDDPRDMTIPWLAWGRGVAPGELSTESVCTMDTAATALWLLGLEPPKHWGGRPVRTAFGEGGVPTSEPFSRAHRCG
jgi:arylsulfatase A-like enzyme